MVISINDASEIPIYQQIRNQIVLGISDGRLAPGEQLPTVRALAERDRYQLHDRQQSLHPLKTGGLHLHRPQKRCPRAAGI